MVVTGEGSLDVAATDPAWVPEEVDMAVEIACLDEGGLGFEAAVGLAGRRDGPGVGGRRGAREGVATGLVVSPDGVVGGRWTAGLGTGGLGTGTGRGGTAVFAAFWTDRGPLLVPTSGDVSGGDGRRGSMMGDVGGGDGRRGCRPRGGVGGRMAWLLFPSSLPCSIS